MSFANDDVLKFYKELPFNIFGSKKEHQDFIKSGVSLNSHPVLTEILSKQKSVLEVGCGVGRFSAQIADQFKSSVTAIDFNPVVIDYAQTAAKALGLNVSYEAADLFKFEPKEKFDICVSLGVLHHTNNCIAAVQRCVTNFVKPGGYFYVGLYHLYGRRPFLQHFANLSAGGASEDDLLKEYARLDNGKTDATYLYSWFRDQVLHPHETQHTLKEITEVCTNSGAKLVSTSINQFKEFKSESELFDGELAYEAVSHQRISEGKYFPGFFTALYHKN
ncbi:MAG: class I SAM-dependent methyltransferase [Actinobacteria bacterium]|nr:MAG: class I SAM-dependent methyltransferase [Actinomycetota bacterium]